MLPAVSIFFFSALQVVWLSYSLAFPRTFLKQNLLPELGEKKKVLVNCNHSFFILVLAKAISPTFEHWEQIITIITLVLKFPAEKGEKNNTKGSIKHKR